MLVVGSKTPPSKNGEVFTFAEGWSDTLEYPYVDASISYHQTVYVPDHSAFYIIGGYSSSDFMAVATIGMLKEGTWSSAGSLLKARRQHVAVWTGTSLIVAGGSPETQPTERCRLDHLTGHFDCIDIGPDLEAYSTGTAFLVNEAYCP